MVFVCCGRLAWLSWRRRGYRSRLAYCKFHRSDLLHLIDDDFLSYTPQLLVLSVAQFKHSHVDRTLVVGYHHGGKVLVDIAGRLDLHIIYHLCHCGLILLKERSFVGCNDSRLLRGYVHLMGEDQGGRCECKGNPRTEQRFTDTGFDKSQHWPPHTWATLR